MIIDCSSPTRSEVERAVFSLKKGKAAGPDGIPAELLQAAGPVVIDRIAHLIAVIWKEETIPSDWENAVLVPLHKKGSRTNCGNYRGISLLTVAFKILE